MITILIFIGVLGLLVLVHELGHFIAAKKAGCYVEEFGIGFPPKLFQIKRGETNYTINLLPLGGYVKIRGENGEDTDDPRSFVNQSFAWKTLIISAGVLMNVLLGYILLTIGLMVGVPTLLSDDSIDRFAKITNEKVQIVQLLPESPAVGAELQLGDFITSVDGQNISNTKSLSDALNKEGVNQVSLGIVRGREEIYIDIIPSELEQLQRKGIGVGLAETATIAYPWYVAPYYGLKQTLYILWLIIAAFASLIASFVQGAGVTADIAGPIGIAVITGEVAKQGIIQLLQFTALLSLNLAIINIIPFPALDGGRLALILLEKIRKKKLNIKFEYWIHTLGFTALIILIIVVTARDISNYGSGIWASIQNIFS